MIKTQGVIEWDKSQISWATTDGVNFLFKCSNDPEKIGSRAKQAILRDALMLYEETQQLKRDMEIAW